MPQTSTHKRSVPRVKSALNPSTPGNIYLVLGSLIEQMLVKHMYVQADAFLSSWSLCCRSLEQDSSLIFPKLAVILS